ncbi:small ribosomal subunit protein mS37 [Calliopsis andreniformis]|uniref:small ribosomal subunit protein mS37 n=1 Tax=Calliopsis andreniformis TaxID=337506 RepID=UPI003FCDEE14
MRLTVPVTKNARAPQNPKTVPFQQWYPLKLQNKVSGLSKNRKENTCLYEMSLVFACLKNNEFQNNLCNKEIHQFQTCVKNYESFKKTQKQLQQVGVPTPETVHFTDSQINYLLRKYPTV